MSPAALLGTTDPGDDRGAALAMRAFGFLLDDGRLRNLVAPAHFAEAVVLLRGVFGERLRHVHTHAFETAAVYSHLFWPATAAGGDW